PTTMIPRTWRRRSFAWSSARPRHAAGPAWAGPPGAPSCPLGPTAKTAQGRDLALALRAELAAIDPARPCDRRALAMGIGRVDTTRDPVLGRPPLRPGRGAQGGPGSRAGAMPADVDEAGFAWGTARDHCRAVYLRGLFLARGS